MRDLGTDILLDVLKLALQVGKVLLPRLGLVLCSLELFERHTFPTELVTKKMRLRMQLSMDVCLPHLLVDDLHLSQPASKNWTHASIYGPTCS